MEVHSGVSIALMLILTTIAFSSLVGAKRRDDIVVLNNGDRMTGEIKSLDYGELKFKSSYSNCRVELLKDLFWNLNLYENFDSRPR
jgi:hypothetical protein